MIDKKRFEDAIDLRIYQDQCGLVYDALVKIDKSENIIRLENIKIDSNKKTFDNLKSSITELANKLGLENPYDEEEEL